MRVESHQDLEGRLGEEPCGMPRSADRPVEAGLDASGRATDCETVRSLSAIIPVYNEVHLTASSVRHIDDYLAKSFADYELIVVESGSTDGTDEVCRRLARELPRLSVIHEGRRAGYGSAVRLGIQKACKDLVLVITVDLPYPLETIRRALPYLDQTDCVLSRREQFDRPWPRRLQSFIFNRAIGISLGIRVRHFNSAFKLFKRPVIQGMDLISDGWFIDAEIVYRVERAGTPQVEIPVRFVERTSGKSTVGALTFLWVLDELRRFKRAIRTA